MESLYDFFGLNEDPFRLTPDPLFFFPSVVHKEALYSLDYVVKEREGFCMMTGEPGTGKTTLLNVFKDRWKDRADIALILTPRLSPDDFLLTLLEDLNVQPAGKNKNEILKGFRNFLIERHRMKKYVIIVVDEAQNVPDDTLEELRLLSNLETEKEKLLQIILMGQPELEARMKKNRLRQLDQRIVERIQLRPFNRDETTEYINHRLSKAGKDFLRLDRKLAIPIYRFSKGIPRLINLVASRTIMSAYIDGCDRIMARHVKYAVKYFSDKNYIRRRRPFFLPASAAAVGVLAAVLCLYGVFLAGQSTAQGPAGGALLKAMLQPAQKTAQQARPGAVPAAEAQAPADAPAAAAPFPAQTAAAVSAASAMRLAVVDVDAANVRLAPRLDSRRIDLLYRGMQVPVLEEALDERNNRWYKIHALPLGAGWVLSALVRVLPSEGPGAWVPGGPTGENGAADRPKAVPAEAAGVSLSGEPVHYSILASSYKNPVHAQNEQERLAQKGMDAYIKTIDLGDGQLWHRVEIGRFDSRGDALAVVRDLSGTEPVEHMRILRN